ncbi:MAG: UDP-glucose 4-epimerase GalE [Rhodospirillaceae bacterium]|nr:MAG: UDP-glucose 4-epimerase GalE [Rhodospirillaceae bacterium]
MSDTVLVTGGAGYIGSHVIHALLDAQYVPVVIDNLSSGVRDFVPDSVPFLVSNINESSRVQDFIKQHSCTSVIHLAGFVSVEESVKDPIGYFNNNTCSSLSLIESCVAENIKHFIFSSSASVYGNPSQVQVPETIATNPISPYGWSKLMTEKMLEGVCAVEPMNAIALRYFNVAGADPDGRCGMMTKNATHLIKVLCETALGKRPQFTIFGTDYDTPDGTCIRDFIHVSDLADIHVAALDVLQKGHSGGTMNCGYGHGFSVQEVVDTVESLHGAPINIERGKRRDGDIVALIADVTKMQAELGWSPRHDDLNKIVETSLKWESRLDK